MSGTNLLETDLMTSCPPIPPITAAVGQITASSLTNSRTNDSSISVSDIPNSLLNIDAFFNIFSTDVSPSSIDLKNEKNEIITRGPRSGYLASTCLQQK